MDENEYGAACPPQAPVGDSEVAAVRRLADAAWLPSRSSVCWQGAHATSRRLPKSSPRRTPVLTTPPLPASPTQRASQSVRRGEPRWIFCCREIADADERAAVEGWETLTQKLLWRDRGAARSAAPVSRKRLLLPTTPSSPSPVAMAPRTYPCAECKKMLPHTEMIKSLRPAHAFESQESGRLRCNLLRHLRA